MRLDQVLQRLQSKAEARKQVVATALVKGHCGDMAAYKDLVGEYRGLSSLQEFVKEVLVEINEEADL